LIDAPYKDKALVYRWFPCKRPPQDSQYKQLTVDATLDETPTFFTLLPFKSYVGRIFVLPAAAAMQQRLSAAL